MTCLKLYSCFVPETRLEPRWSDSVLAVSFYTLKYSQKHLCLATPTTHTHTHFGLVFSSRDVTQTRNLQFATQYKSRQTYHMSWQSGPIVYPVSCQTPASLWVWVPYTGSPKDNKSESWIPPQSFKQMLALCVLSHAPDGSRSWLLPAGPHITL